jgi:hypothetical protein
MLKAILSILGLDGRHSAPKDFPRSRDVHYVPRLLLANLPEFKHFDEEWDEQSLSLTPSGDLHAAFETELLPFESYEYHPERFVHSMPGLVEGFRVAFTNRRILTRHARMHQLLYFKDQLVLVDAKINSMDPDGTVDEAPALVTPVGNLDWPHPKAPQVRAVQGFRDAQGRRLSLHNEVNLHLRLLANPGLFKELVQAATKAQHTKGNGAKPF